MKNMYNSVLATQNFTYYLHKYSLAFMNGDDDLGMPHTYISSLKHEPLLELFAHDACSSL